MCVPLPINQNTGQRETGQNLFCVEEFIMRKALKSSLPVLLFLSLMLLSVNGESRSGQSGAKTAAPTGPADYVNTFVGTAGRDMGNTYPGAALPFGMIQWSPETTTGFIKHDGSYFYGDDGYSRIQPHSLERPRLPDHGGCSHSACGGCSGVFARNGRHRLFGKVLPHATKRLRPGSTPWASTTGRRFNWR